MIAFFLFLLKNIAQIVKKFVKSEENAAFLRRFFVFRRIKTLEIVSFFDMFYGDFWKKFHKNKAEIFKNNRQNRRQKRYENR